MAALSIPTVASVRNERPGYSPWIASPQRSTGVWSNAETSIFQFEDISRRKRNTNDKAGAPRWFARRSPVPDLGVDNSAAVVVPAMVRAVDDAPIVSDSRSPYDRLLSNTARDVLSDLERLGPDWAGAGTAAPKHTAIRDLETLISYFPPSFGPPEVEIDPEDGSLTLIWSRNSVTFALILLGDARVIGTLAGERGRAYEPWTLPISREIAIARYLEDDVVVAVTSR